MTFTEAAAEVLRLVGKPLHYKDITEFAIQRNLLSHVGKSPEVTMGSRLATLLKKSAKENPLVRIKPGVFALRVWEETGPPGPASEADGTVEKTEKSQETVAQAPAVTPAVGKKESRKPADSSQHVTLTTLLPSSQEDDIFPEASEPASKETESNERENEREAVGLPAALEPFPPMVEPPPAPRRSAAIPLTRPHELTEPDEVLRAGLAASAREVFDEEEDDDQPILGDDASPDTHGGPRRRRRRRRGRSGDTLTVAGSRVESTSGDETFLPSYTVSPAFGDAPSGQERSGREGRSDENNLTPTAREAREPREPRESREPRLPREPRRDERRDDRTPRGAAVVSELGAASNGGGEEEIAGRDMANLVVSLLQGAERSGTPVALRVLAEAGQRKARLVGDATAIQSHMAAAVRADNLRRQAVGQRPRFRLQAGRVALTDWVLGADVVRLENEAMLALERYREAMRRVLSRRLAELPPAALIEVCVTLLERLGVGQLRIVRRPGFNGTETHFAGTHRSPIGEHRLAVVIRRDGREISRERVIELRGALHHYGSASAGWLLTSGQVLSGAREEAAAPGAASVVLFDGIAVARACEENEVAVLRTLIPMAIPDIDFLDSLRAP